METFHFHFLDFESGYLFNLCCLKHLQFIIGQTNLLSEPFKALGWSISQPITNSDLNRPCFAWHPYGKSGLFKTELVIVLALGLF